MKHKRSPLWADTHELFLVWFIYWLSLTADIADWFPWAWLGIAMLDSIVYCMRLGVLLERKEQGKRD